MTKQLDLDLMEAIAGGKSGAIRMLIKALETERAAWDKERRKLEEASRQSVSDKATTAARTEQLEAVVTLARKLWNTYGALGKPIPAKDDPLLLALHDALVAVDTVT
jgi:hypothetical protein